MTGIDQNGHEIKIGKGPIRHTSLPPKLVTRLRQIWSVIGEYDRAIVFEKFELDFMRDTHPEREIEIWERIAEAFAKIIAEYPTVDRRNLLRDISRWSLGQRVPSQYRRWWKHKPIPMTSQSSATGEVMDVFLQPGTAEQAKDGQNHTDGSMN